MFDWSEIKRQFKTRLVLQVLCAVPAGLVGYFSTQFFDAWGVLDRFTMAMGGWFKVNVTPDQAGWSLTLVVALALYGLMLWVSWYWGPRVQTLRQSPPIVELIHIPKPSVPTWYDLERRFRELEPALQFSRIDGQTGAAGEYWRIAGGFDRDATSRFEATAAIASTRLFQDFTVEINSYPELEQETDPTIRWYKALQYIGNKYEHGPMAEQVNDDGSSGGFLYRGSILRPATVSATLCLTLASRAPQT
jgi:hypothetical protein